MNTQCKDFVRYVIELASVNSKKTVEDDVSAHFRLTRDRTVYHNQSYAVRFCYSKSTSASFSNTVLSLSALEKYDKIPFFVVLIRKNADNLIFLANTTFLKKISHSSQKLSMTNIKGSFNGSDIIRVYDGRANSFENFDFLFAIHQEFSWNENLERLVEATSNIEPTNKKFIPTNIEEANIFNSVTRAASFIASVNFTVLEADLNERCNKCRNEIMIASHIENTNIRGRLIESLITADDDVRQNIINSMHDLEKDLPVYDIRNGLGDYCREFDNCYTYTDIKTKIIYLGSNPKAYNIDKFLRQMADNKSVCLFFFIGIDEHSIFRTLLCSVFHKPLLKGTILQYHWAGRKSRGVAQFNGCIIDEMMEDPEFKNEIDETEAKDFLLKLLKR